MKPLEGLRCLTVEQFGAGPYGTMFLADLGAEVIKIENPATGGDPARYGPPPLLGDADSLYFQSWNTNKRSISIDLKSSKGREAFENLAKSCDVVVNNLRGDQPEKLGLTYAHLCDLNPAIVCLHVSAYGRDNDRASRPGYDYLMQAETGLMSLTGDPDGPPSRFGPSVIDYMIGITGALGMLACVWRARTTGIGCDVDVSLFDVALHQLSYNATWFLNKGIKSTRLPRSAHFGKSPVQTFKASDGWIFIMCLSEKFWKLLVQSFPHLNLDNDPRFAENSLRMANQKALSDILDAEFGKATVAEWIERLGKTIPIGPIRDLEQALENPFLEQSSMITSIAHTNGKDLKLLSNPIKINGERLTLRPCSPLGSDNASILDTDTIAKTKTPSSRIK
jgi:crotonobetainyl-CoA:carnitine CoA-transferase CaiB-like acyl-CoA transferase